jgi:hypothetical protein
MSTELVPQIGDVWKEADKRFNRYVAIIGDHGGPAGKVQIQSVYRKPETIGWRSYGPRTWASAKRFNNRSGGYKLVIRRLHDH